MKRHKKVNAKRSRKPNGKKAKKRLAQHFLSRFQGRRLRTSQSLPNQIRSEIHPEKTKGHSIFSLVRLQSSPVIIHKKSVQPLETNTTQETKLVQPIVTNQNQTESKPPFSNHTLTKVKLRETMEAFLLDQRAENTRRAYQKDLKRFFTFLLVWEAEKGRAPELNRNLLIAYKEGLLSDNLEHTTVDRHLATLRSFFRWVKEDGLLEKNPLDGVRFLKPKRISRTLGFSNEEVLRMLAIPDLHTRVGAQHYAILMVLFYCGLRRSELCALKTSQLINEREKWVFRLRGKGNKERFIVLTPQTWNAIRYVFRITQRSFEVDDFVFKPIRHTKSQNRDKPLDSSLIFYIVRKYARQAGILSKVSPHSCRATAISNARDHHVPDRAIQEFAGWASPDMITRYDKRKTAVEESASLSIRYGTEKEERIKPYYFEITPAIEKSPPQKEAPHIDQIPLPTESLQLNSENLTSEPQDE